MKREYILTADGSHTIAIPEMGVTYHSFHGAIQESMHVFIESGLHYLNNKEQGLCNKAILEMGFGTGLNALLTLAEAEKNRQLIHYETLELYPLEPSEYAALNYCMQIGRPDLQPMFDTLHHCDWNTPIAITPYFHFIKRKTSLLDFTSSKRFNLIYFDAFAPEIQPGLWTMDVFKRLWAMAHQPAVLTTYCSKSIVRKAMAAAGWTVTKIPGPPRKREMVRALTVGEIKIRVNA